MSLNSGDQQSLFTFLLIVAKLYPECDSAECRGAVLCRLFTKIGFKNFQNNEYVKWKLTQWPADKMTLHKPNLVIVRRMVKISNFNKWELELDYLNMEH